jgi:cellulose synthase operon protein C
MIRAKTKRRLVILLVLAVAGTGALGGAYVIRRAYLRSQAQQAGQKGLAAAKAGDYDAALPQLGQYLGRFPGDTDALYYYALARQHVQEPNNRQFGEAISLWRHLLDLKPDSVEARRQLLDLYVNLGFSNETLDTAETLLRGLPDDPAALRAKAIALTRLRRFPDAVATIQHLNQLHPEDLDNQLLALSIQQSSGVAPDQIVKSVDALRQAHPNDVHFALLQSIARANAGDRTGAAAAIRESLAKPPADPKTLAVLLDQLDALDLHAESLAAAKTAVAQNPGVLDCQRILASHLIYAGDYRQLDVLLKEVSPANAGADAQLLAIKGLALGLQGHPQEAGAIFDALAARPKASSDRIASALVSAARSVWLDAPDAKVRVDTCSQALLVDRKNPFLHFFLGQAYALQKDADGALREWQAAYSLAPAWGLPLSRSARMLLEAGQAQQALSVARAAQSHMPDDEDTLVTLASAWSSTLDITKTADADSLLAFLRDLLKRYPTAEQARPLLIYLLSHLGTSEQSKKDYQAQASQEFQAALNLTPPPSELTFLQLAAVSRINKMQLEDECYSRSEKAHGMTPQLAFAKALWMVGAGKPKDGLAFFESVLPKPSTDSVWQLAYARLLGQLNDPRAKAVWIALADAFPKDAQVQWAALTASAVQDDHEFIGRSIQNLREQLGQDNVQGRLAQAMWLLQGKPTEKQTSEATLLLSDITRAAPNLVEARVLLAKCLRQLGNISGAVEQLRIAAQARPEDTSVVQSLASLYLAQGEVDSAREQLNRLAQSPVSSAQRQQIATMYMSLGDTERAVQILEKDPDPSSSLMLAQLYLQQNQPAKAEALCKTLFENPSPGVIEVYATLLASQGRQPEADTVLAKLDAVEARPGIRELLRANYLARFGKPEDALTQYLAATRTAPKDGNPWRQLLVFCLHANRVDDVARYVSDAHTNVPTDVGFTALADHTSELRQLAAEPAALDLFAALLQNANDVPSIVESIVLAQAAKTQTQPVSEIAPKIRQLADRNPRVLALQLFAAQYHLAAGRLDDAVTIAMRASAAFPNSPEAAQVAASALAGAGRWNEVIAVATQWRQRDPAHALQADTAIAAAKMQLGNLSDGMTQLSPYLDRALKSPDEYPTIVVLYVQNLIATKQVDKASQLLEPLLSSPRWRNLCLSVAASIGEPVARGLWLDRASAAIPADAVAEKIQLALEYQRLALLTKDPAFDKKARDIVDPLVARVDANPAILTAVASLYETQKDVAAAEQLYRRVLKADPNQAVALNNLAMILANADRDLPEALDLASRAVKLAPVAGLYDTLAFVQAHQKAYDNALASIGQALKLDPNNLEWQASRIWILALNGRRDTATAELQQMQTAKTYDKLSENSRLRLASVGLK